jgi:hypothetical protein
MSMSNAERQARYRQRRKEQGLKRRDNWVTPKTDGKRTKSTTLETLDSGGVFDAEASWSKYFSRRNEGLGTGNESPIPVPNYGCFVP